tara:strand:- start:1184 stop:1480 length:297 start_codon:yes stop_codon:yes gene_type:complete
MTKANKIIDAVVLSSGVTIDELMSGSRKRRVSLPRQMAAYLIRKNTELSYQKVADRLNLNEPSTVKVAFKTIEGQIEFKQPDTTSLYEETLIILGDGK